MGAITNCNYEDCYYNHNIKHICLLESVTLDFTGKCENIMHCDDYECGTCERFQICTKEKKRLYGSSQPKPVRAVLRYPTSVQIEYCDNVHCIYCKNSKCLYSGGISLDENGTCQLAEYRDENHQNRKNDDFSSTEDSLF